MRTEYPLTKDLGPGLPRKILSIAWVGHGDFGDEAMAFALRRALLSRKLPQPTYYQSDDLPRFRSPDEEVSPVVHPHDRPDRLRRLLDQVQLRRFDTVLIGGGSLFHSEESVAWKHNIVRAVRRKYGPRALVACIGVSAGPFRHVAAETKFKVFAKDVDCWVLRDTRSAEIVRSAKISSSDVFAAVDLSFLLPDIWGRDFPRHGDQVVNGPIGLSFVKRADDRSFRQEGRFRYYLDVLNSVLAGSRGRDIVLFNLYTGVAYADIKMNECLARKCVEPSRVRVHTFGGDVSATVREISRCSAMLSMRLHGAVFAYLTGVPFVSLGYDPKNRQFCATAKYPDRFVFDVADRPSADELATAVMQAAADGPAVFSDTLPISEGAQQINAGLDRISTLAVERG